MWRFWSVEDHEFIFKITGGHYVGQFVGCFALYVIYLLCTSSQLALIYAKNFQKEVIESSEILATLNSFSRSQEAILLSYFGIFQCLKYLVATLLDWSAWNYASTCQEKVSQIESNCWWPQIVFNVMGHHVVKISSL